MKFFKYKLNPARRICNITNIKRKPTWTFTFHYKVLLNKPPTGFADTKETENETMASMSFSATIPSPLLDFSQTKKNPVFSSSWPSMSFSIPSTKSSLGSSKSAFFQNGFSLLSLTASGFVFNSRSSGIYARAATDKTLYDYTVKDIDGKDTPLSKFKGKVLLIVNVASRCGLTTSNYSELSHIYDKYKNQGFEILAFPCNQFGGQEPGSNPDIKNFACTRFKAEFPIFDKVSQAALLFDYSIYGRDKFLKD
ncbi:putative glutathione peroxidase 8 isoform X2 [Gossypium australe]|uniref:Glutathione peroxidase n=1 Tax=Gossypium australe TaxID=47621 RepID=A0A5B6UWJ3_9ROSI|nr:putative glutathione peroxidase 8 isoform X2 [Gossypium australe]